MHLCIFMEWLSKYQHFNSQLAIIFKLSAPIRVYNNKVIWERVNDGNLQNTHQSFNELKM